MTEDRPRVRIRAVTLADVARWAELRSALWPAESRAELAEEATVFLAGGLRHVELVLVARVDEDVVGFAEVSRRAYAEGCLTSPVGFLEGWFVEPGYRGLGVGRALVSAAESWARGEGCREFASDTEYDNLASAAAHEALGFAEVETLRCFRKDLGAHR